MNYLLHISNTDISVDSRILKEIAALSSLPNSKVFAIGVADDHKESEKSIDGGTLLSIRLRSRLLTWLPRAVRYAIEMVEFTIRVVILGRRLLRKSTVSGSVVHCHDTFALPSGSILRRMICARVVYDAHELESNKNGQNILLSKATFAIERILWRDIDLLISVSNSIIAWYDQELGAKPSCLVLNSPVYKSHSELSGNSFNSNYLRNKFSIPSDAPVFVYLGILASGRGIENCLEAFTRVSKRAHVVFIGFGVLESLIDQYAMANENIHRHDAVKHEEVVPLVSSADYGLCLVENASLSDYFCLPNKLFEYCFAGLGVLGSRLPEIESVIEEYDLGIVCDSEPDAIATAVHSLLHAPLRRLNHDLGELSWQSQAARLRDSYTREILR